MSTYEVNPFVRPAVIDVYPKPTHSRAHGSAAGSFDLGRTRHSSRLPTYEDFFAPRPVAARHGGTSSTGGQW